MTTVFHQLSFETTNLRGTDTADPYIIVEFEGEFGRWYEAELRCVGLCDVTNEYEGNEDDEWAERVERFADPGGESALYAASEDNPRNLPCPTCGWPNRLTPKDRAAGYQCDACATALERGGRSVGGFDASSGEV